ncbi:tripartite tricarboxylate transporter substrate binding protein [Paracidovorax citrulli]
MQRRDWLKAAGAVTAAGALGSLGLASARAKGEKGAWPERPVRLIVPFLAGTSPDITARNLAAELGPKLGQSLVVENIPGAGGIIGAQAIKRAEPDGYTLGLLANQHVINVNLYRNKPYDPAKDFQAIAALSGGPTVLAVPADAPWKTAAELIEAMRREPGKFNYGSGGKGSVAHLAVEALLHQTGTQAVHIPYKGATEIITAMLSGQTQFGMPVIGTATQFLRNKQIRILAVTTQTRSTYFPQVPTLAEALPPGFELDNWSGLFAPAGVPAPIVQKLFTAVTALQDAGKLTAQIEANSGELRRSASPAQFHAMVGAEARRYAQMMQAIGMEPSAG